VTKKPTASPNRKRLYADVAVFVQQYGRKAQRHCEPNDRRYDRNMERKLKHLKPEKLDELLRGDSDE
jgi:predicted secreted Zn-dependent protease